MPSIISPYALLCASKPKPRPVSVTPYDLYSISHTPSPEIHSESHDEYTQKLPISRNDSSQAYLPRLPATRTHYISSIRARNTVATQKALFKKS